MRRPRRDRPLLEEVRSEEEAHPALGGLTPGGHQASGCPLRAGRSGGGWAAGAGPRPNPGSSHPHPLPSAGMSNQETLQQIGRGYRLPCPAACPAEVYALMLKCWKGSPEERPTFAMLWEKLGSMHGRLHLGLL